MKFKSRIAALVLAGAMIVGATAGCGGSSSGGTGSGSASGDKGTIGLIMMTLDNEFYVAMKNGAQEACGDLGYELNVQAGTSHSDAAEQLQLMENMIQQGVKAIMITPCSSTGITQGIKEANAAGIPVVILDTEVDRDALEKENAETLAYIGSNNYDGGKSAGEYAKKVSEEMGKTLNAVIIQGVAGQENMELRSQGFEDAAGDSVNIVATQNADSDYNKSYDVMTNILTSNSEIDMVYCCNDLMALGAYQACKEKGLSDVKIIGFDGTSDALNAIKDGKLCGTVAQKPADMAIQGVQTIDADLNGESFEDTIYTDCSVVDADGVDDFLAYVEKYVQ